MHQVLAYEGEAQEDSGVQRASPDRSLFWGVFVCSFVRSFARLDVDQDGVTSWVQLEEERKSEIDRENRQLLQKMSKIMQTSGGLDNRNDYVARRYDRLTRIRAFPHLIQSINRPYRRPRYTSLSLIFDLNSLTLG
jgi:hypothetical protein